MAAGAWHTKCAVLGAGGAPVMTQQELPLAATLAVELGIEDQQAATVWAGGRDSPFPLARRQSSRVWGCSLPLAALADPPCFWLLCQGQPGSFVGLT